MMSYYQMAPNLQRRCPLLRQIKLHNHTEDASKQTINNKKISALFWREGREGLDSSFHTFAIKQEFLLSYLGTVKQHIKVV